MAGVKMCARPRTYRTCTASTLALLYKVAPLTLLRVTSRELSYLSGVSRRDWVGCENARARVARRIKAGVRLGSVQYLRLRSCTCTATGGPVHT